MLSRKTALAQVRMYSFGKAIQAVGGALLGIGIGAQLSYEFNSPLPILFLLPFVGGFLWFCQMALKEARRAKTLLGEDN
jgi:hypothetical protein